MEQRGQASVEWVALTLLVALALGAAVAAGVRLPGVALARALSTRILCAVSLSGDCGERFALAEAYGEEVAALVRGHAPGLAYEQGMRALPVDFRRCRRTRCGDGAEQGYVARSAAGQPVVAFVHVVDCRSRAGVSAAGDCSGPRRGNLYIQYWTYYPDSATLRGVPVAGAAGYHRDDWEGVQVRIGPDGEADERATSHAGYNYGRGPGNWASDAGIGPLRDLEEAVGLRRAGGWGPETGWLFVSGGSHAGSAVGEPWRVGRVTRRRDLRLVPLEPVAAGAAGRTRFVIAPPWRKAVWRDPEASGTD
ncbi:MAG: hypothetical protein U0R52_09430 [Solirubrobacterales bacterium]